MSARRLLLAASAALAALLLLARDAARPEAAHPGVPAELAGHFTAGGGWFPGEPFLSRGPVQAWGSWSGHDDHHGRVAVGPFPAPARLKFAVGGYPTRPGIRLAVEHAGTGERRPVDAGPDIGERWRVLHWEVPSEWRGQAVRILAEDEAAGPGGWIAVTEPLRGGRGEGRNALYTTLAGFALNGLLLFLLWRAALAWLAPRGWFAPAWLPLGAAAAVAAAAYGVFWAYFAHPLAGRAAAAALLLAAAARVLRRPLPPVPAEARLAGLLAAAAGFFALALLHLYPTLLSFDDLAANRFRERMPSDNVLPYDLARRLHAGEPAINPLAQWQSSDRPPLQSGWELLTWWAGELAGLDDRTASGTAAVWFQLLWVPAAYGLLRTLGLRPARAAGWTAALALTGLALQHTTFTWPKLPAAALLAGAWALGFAPPGGTRRPRDHALAGALAVLAWLSHGGAAFSLLALGPWLLAALRRDGPRGGIAAGLVFLAGAVPWLAYQRFHEPPGNRLLKWHLAGAEAPDPRGFLETLREAYTPLTWREVAARKAANVGVLFAGHWRALGDVSAEHAKARRHDEFFFTARALTWWNAAPALLALALLRRRARDALAATAGFQLALLGWTLLTLAVWCLLMFTPGSTVIHQGSLAVPLVLFALLSRWADAAGGWALPALAGLQAVTLATTYGRPNEMVAGPPTGLPFVLLGAAGLAAFIVAALRPERAPAPAAAPAPTAPPARPGTAPAAPAAPRGRRLLILLALLAGLLALRKPDALLNPQLWAEDGSVFLVEHERLGAAAFLEPYMGYLHTLPRLAAWAAGTLLDPAWWPAAYAGVAWLAWFGVIARLFSPRLPLPHRTWLALALFAGPHTGEILFNLTNVQWVTAFLIVQQALLARPENARQRVGDLVLLAIAGLTGPFIVALLPLLLWRAWRDRDGDAIAAAVVACACAALQAVPLRAAAGAVPLAPPQLLEGLVVVSRRLLVWPFFGPAAAHALPDWATAALGAVVLPGLAWCALRPHPLRRLRGTVLAAGVLLLAAGCLRARPDTWTGDDLIFSDRYFFAPRVLLLWLLVLEGDAAGRIARWAARLAVAAFLLVHAPGHRLPAATDHRWREQCAPLRRGEPAKIPILPDGWILDYPGRPARPNP